MSWAFTHRTNPILDTWADKPDYSMDGEWYNMSNNDPNPVSKKMYDSVAGEINPSPKACSKFAPDGRSDICLACDWPEHDHYRDDFTMALRQALTQAAAQEIWVEGMPKHWWQRIFRRR